MKSRPWTRREFAARATALVAGMGGASRTLGSGGEHLDSGDVTHSLVHEGRERTYLVHVPPGVDKRGPVPVVLALHPIAANGRFMVGFCRMNEVADREGFLVVYPDGSGRSAARTWNAGGVGNVAADDVGFLGRVLDRLADQYPVDTRRVYATGMSNGAMMCYRLAAELGSRVAAIAPVSGTMAVETIRQGRAVPVLHFHGTADRIVPFDGPSPATPGFIRFLSVDETMRRWAEANGCPREPETETQAAEPPGLPVERRVYAPGRERSEVILLAIQGAGHVWPGVTTSGLLLGAGAPNVRANELIWEFFRRHGLT